MEPDLDRIYARVADLVRLAWHRGPTPDLTAAGGPAEERVAYLKPGQPLDLLAALCLAVRETLQGGAQIDDWRPLYRRALFPLALELRARVEYVSDLGDEECLHFFNETLARDEIDVIALVETVRGRLQR